MLKFIDRAYEKLKEFYGPRHFPALLALLFIISVAGLVVGLKYSRYIQKDPEYCNSCHLMQDTYNDWKNSDHKTVNCQECHQLGVIEQNMLQLKLVLYGNKKSETEHARAKPWETCASCHWEQQKQGQAAPGESHGHYRHHFVECFNCHPFEYHDFPFKEGSCSKCHPGKEVHGAGMEGLACEDCHIFSQREGTEKNRVIPTRERCKACHETAGEREFPPDAPMASLECFACHNPHEQIKPDEKVCVGCHEADLTGRGHRIHAKNACKDCHTAHKWKAGDIKDLCGGCHAPKPMDVFR